MDNGPKGRAINLLENRETFAVWPKQKLLMLNIVVGITFKRNISGVSLVLCTCSPSFFLRCDLITGWLHYSGHRSDVLTS